MRVNKWGVGVILAAAVMLTGCSAGASDKPAADPKPESSASQEAEAPTSNCPELSEGATVDGAAVGACIAEASASIAGYATTSTVLGMETTGRYNPSERALESITPIGSVIVIGDQAWVKASGDWQVADAASSDPIIAGLSAGATTAAQASPTAIADLLAGEFTVTGTGERLGQQVFLLSGTFDIQGVSSEIVLELTKDFAPLATTSKAEVSGTTVESTTLVTEWDVAQDIVAPL